MPLDQMFFTVLAVFHLFFVYAMCKWFIRKQEKMFDKMEVAIRDLSLRIVVLETRMEERDPQKKIPVERVKRKYTRRLQVETKNNS